MKQKDFFNITKEEFEPSFINFLTLTYPDRISELMFNYYRENSYIMIYNILFITFFCYDKMLNFNFYFKDNVVAIKAVDLYSHPITGLGTIAGTTMYHNMSYKDFEELIWKNPI